MIFHLVRDASHDVGDGYDVADAHLGVAVDVGALDDGGIGLDAGHDVGDGDDVADAHLPVVVDVAHIHILGNLIAISLANSTIFSCPAIPNVAV